MIVSAIVALVAAAEPSAVPFLTVDGCTFRKRRWSGTADLAAVSGGPSFAHLFVDSREAETSGPTARVSFSPGSEAQPLIEFEQGGLRVRGFVALDAVPLHFRGEGLVAGVLVPAASARFVVTGRTDDSLSLSWKPESVQLRAPLSEPITRSCSALTLDERVAEASPRPMTAKLGSRRRRMLSAATPVSATPEGTPVLDLPFRTPVVVLDRRKDWAQIASLEIRELTVIGWIPARMLATRGTAGSFTMSIACRAASCCDVVGDTQCPHDLELAIEVAGSRTVVGTLRAGTRFAKSPEDGGWTGIQVEGGEWLKVAEGASWSVPTSELLQCQTVQPH